MNTVVCAARRTRDFCVKNKAYLLSFFIPAALLFISYMLFQVYPMGERSVLALDLNAQYVYYYDYMYDVFAGKESLFYSWSRTFSGEFFGTFAYYLASPFNFIVWLFPRTSITEGLLTMLLVKSASCGLVCALFLKKQRGFSDLTVTLFSVMYALSGYFAAHSINPMWLDGVIALPLVLMGVEHICDRKRMLLYSISLLYVFVSNFYIGYMVGIFSAFYFAYYIASGKIKDKNKGSLPKSALLYGASSLASIFMSCWIVIPVYKALQMGKLGFGDSVFSPAENFNITDALLKLFPGTFDTIRPEGMPMIYSGTLALIFAIVYFTMRKIPLRQRISGGVLLGFIILSMYIKPVDMLWHGGSVPVWMPYRYSFIAVFLLIVFGAEAFENIKFVRRKTIGGIFAALLALLLVADHYAGSENFNTTLIIVIPLIVLGVVSIAVVLYKKYRSYYVMKPVILGLVCVEIVLNNLVTFSKMDKDIYYSMRASYVDDIPKTREVVNEVKFVDGGFYRMEKTYHRCVNDPIATGLYGMSHSSSVFNSNAIALAKKIGFGAREHYSRYDGATPLTDDILGVKYVLSQSELLSQYKNTLDIKSSSDIKVYENEDALGFAYLADKRVINSTISDKSPFYAQQTLAALLSGETQSIYTPVGDYYLDLVNLNAGSTTDKHLSYKKRLNDDEASVNYNITASIDGRVYMYLPSLYERECKLYVNGEFIKYYFENENHSIAYLGEFRQGEEFSVKLELLKEDVYYEEPQFYAIDDAALEKFSEKMRSMNAGTTVTRTGKSKLSITVDADKDCALFTTIPYEEGWTATVDGEEVPISRGVDKTFMCLNVKSGKHTIELSFFPAGMKTGIILSIGGGVMFAAIIVITVTLRKHKPVSDKPDDDPPEDGE